ncbi:MAG: hypothetical protein PVSMB1_10360 [Gemmatimonadaceae bacterium]
MDRASASIAGASAWTLIVEFTWVFARAGESIEIRRSADVRASQLIVLGAEGSRTIDFGSHPELVAYQTQFEAHLLGSGWLFVQFEPERRGASDRRQRPRGDAERRATILPWRPLFLED